jgi:hypothetical protein
MAIGKFYSKWFVALILYGLLVLLLLWIRPSMMFDANGHIKDFGTSTSATESVFSIKIMFPLIAIVSYYVAGFIEVMFAAAPVIALPGI